MFLQTFHVKSLRISISHQQNDCKKSPSTIRARTITNSRYEKEIKNSKFKTRQESGSQRPPACVPVRSTYARVTSGRVARDKSNPLRDCFMGRAMRAWCADHPAPYPFQPRAPSGPAAPSASRSASPFWPRAPSGSCGPSGPAPLPALLPHLPAAAHHNAPTGTTFARAPAWKKFSKSPLWGLFECRRFGPRPERIVLQCGHQPARPPRPAPP